MGDDEKFSAVVGKTEPVGEITPDCEAGIHDYPAQDFVIGPRVCDNCGQSEY